MFLMIGIGMGVTFANGNDDVTPGAKRTFEREFPQARFAKWERISNTDVFMVRFIYNDQALFSTFSVVAAVFVATTALTNAVTAIG